MFRSVVISDGGPGTVLEVFVPGRNSPERSESKELQTKHCNAFPLVLTLEKRSLRFVMKVLRQSNATDLTCFKAVRRLKTGQTMCMT